MTENKQLDQLAINAIRVLSAESVQKANSGIRATWGPAILTNCGQSPELPIRMTAWINRDRLF